MNKQQLASKIWESANKRRSKIEANEYKDYILGFIFYKFLSDKEEQFLRKDGWETEDLKELSEEDTDTVEYCRRQLGYFISYDNLFSTWLNKGKDFDVSNVTDALSAFNRLIDPRHKKVFEKILDTLDTGLTKLGDTSGARTKAISNLIQLIKDIPMDGKEDYDVLGFIYEYLISNFAANAGKKAGEFYTPHEVSLLMSEIVADHLKDRDKIEILGLDGKYGQMYDCVDDVFGEDLDCWYCEECGNLAVFVDLFRYDFIRMDNLPSITFNEVLDWEEYIALRNQEFEDFQDFYQGKSPIEAIRDYSFKYKYRLSPDKKNIYAFDSSGKLQFGYEQSAFIEFESEIRNKKLDDDLTRVEIKYHRVTKINPAASLSHITSEFVTWDYNEQLVIDSETETIEHL